jgi:twitching motility protein PilT
MSRLDEIVAIAREVRASDVHISPNDPLRFRIDGSLKILNDVPLSAEECEALARLAAGDDGYGKLVRVGEYDMSGTYSGVRCRLNIYRVDGGYCIALRLLAEGVPDLMKLGLPPIVTDFTTYQKGIVLVTGETGSGKSTTLAAIVNEINNSRPDHIITLEDPIEYVYTSKKSLVNQREIGRDTESFAAGLRAILREDPDVILVGEMRDLDTIETALTAAETGHLVFGTLHTQSAADSVDRLVDVFPEARQRQIRMQLSMTLKAVVSQQLLVRAGGEGRALAAEVMIVNPAIRNLIREGKTPQIENTLASSADLGSITMDNMLIKMVRARTISAQTAIEAAHDPDYVKRLAR